MYKGAVSDSLQVRLCRQKTTGKVFAMKKLKKAEMVRRGQVSMQHGFIMTCFPICIFAMLSAQPTRQGLRNAVSTADTPRLLPETSKVVQEQSTISMKSVQSSLLQTNPFSVGH